MVLINLGNLEQSETLLWLIDYNLKALIKMKPKFASYYEVN